MLHIKLKGIEHRAPWKQICCHYTHQRPLGGVKRSFFSFLKVVMFHIKLKWKNCWPTCKVTLLIYAHPWPLGSGLKVRYWNCADVSIFLAHLSWRLRGELLVYGWLRRPSSVVRQHFQTSSPLKPLGQLNSNFIWRLLRMGEQKFVQMFLVMWPRWPPCPYMVKTL